MILSGLAFVLVNFFVKALGHPENFSLIPGLQAYPAHELVFFRSVISFAISLYIIKRRRLPVLGNNKKWLMIRGVTGMIALTLFFYTLQALPLAIASTVQYLAPLFTVLLATRILRERVLPVQWLFILVSFSGIVVIGLNDFLAADRKESISTLWLLAGILSAFFSGIAYNAIAKLRDTDTPINIVLYFPMIAAPLTGIWCLFDFTFPVGIEWLILLIIGIFTQIAQVLLTKAFHHGTASRIAPFQYLGSIYALLIGYFIFDENLSLIAYGGMLLILAGIVGNALWKMIRGRRERRLAANQ